jgi:hypothetical protein
VWCTLSCMHVGPIFFEETVDGNVYWAVITHFISFLQVNECDCCLQQNGAICHMSNETMTFLQEFFGSHLFSNDLWPQRSPDL